MYNKELLRVLALLCGREIKLTGTHIGSPDAVEYEEDVVERDGAEEVEKEPGLDVVLGDQLGVDDHLLTVVLLHDAWKRDFGRTSESFDQNYREKKVYRFSLSFHFGSPQRMI